MWQWLEAMEISHWGGGHLLDSNSCHLSLAGSRILWYDTYLGLTDIFVMFVHIRPSPLVQCCCDIVTFGWPNYMGKVPLTDLWIDSLNSTSIQFTFTRSLAPLSASLAIRHLPSTSVTDAFQVGSGDAERDRWVSEAGRKTDKDLASTSKLRPRCTRCPYLESWVRQKKRRKPKLIFRLELQVDTSRYIY